MRRCRDTDFCRDSADSPADCVVMMASTPDGGGNLPGSRQEKNRFACEKTHEAKTGRPYVPKGTASAKRRKGTA
jgi:hypothetical protein